MKSRTVLLPLTKFAFLMLTSVFAFGISRTVAQENSAAAVNHPKWNYDELMNVPDRARDRQNPFQGDPTAVRAGGKLFEQHCSECHGMKAEGGKRGPSLLSGEVQRVSPGAIFWILTNGVVRHGMPVWSKLPEPQRWQIVAFLKSFKNSPDPQMNLHSAFSIHSAYDQAR